LRDPNTDNKRIEKKMKSQNNPCASVTIHGHSRRSLLSLLPDLVIPLIFLLVAGFYLHARGPSWLDHYMDPDYAYLLNGLVLAKGGTPWHVDHPGVVLHLWIAGVLRVTHPLVGKQDLVQDVLQRPEFYLQVVQWTLLLAIAAAVVYAGHTVRRLASRAIAYIASPIS